jgi:hypothetical protein
LVARVLGGELATVDGLVQRRQRLRAQQRRREQLVLGWDLRPVAREREDDVDVDDELAYAGTASFSISGAYMPVRAALFIFARW